MSYPLSLTVGIGLFILVIYTPVINCYIGHACARGSYIFVHVGVDYVGPLQMPETSVAKTAYLRTMCKVYIAILKCLFCRKSRPPGIGLWSIHRGVPHRYTAFDRFVARSMFLSDVNLCI